MQLQTEDLERKLGALGFEPAGGWRSQNRGECAIALRHQDEETYLEQLHNSFSKAQNLRVGRRRYEM